MWNALDYSACVFPVTKVDPAIDVKRPAHTFLGKRDEEAYNFCKLVHLAELYSAHIAVQMIPRPGEVHPSAYTSSVAPTRKRQ